MTQELFTPSSWASAGRPSVVPIPRLSPPQVLALVMYATNIWEMEALFSGFGPNATKEFSSGRTSQTFVPTVYAVPLQTLVGGRISPETLLILFNPNAHARLHPQMVKIYKKSPLKPELSVNWKAQPPRTGDERRDIFDKIFIAKGIQKGLTGLACALGKESNTGHLSRIRSGEQNLPAWDLMAIQRLPGRRVPPEQLIQLLKEENRTLYYPLLLLATAEFDESEPPVANRYEKTPAPSEKAPRVKSASKPPPAKKPLTPAVTPHDIRQSAKTVLFTRLFSPPLPSGTTAPAAPTIEEIANRFRQSSGIVRGCFSLATTGFSPYTVIEVRAFLAERGVALTDSECELICNPSNIEVLRELLQGKPPTPKHITPPKREKERRRKDW